MKSTKQPSNCPLCGGTASIFQKDLFDDRYGAPGKHAVYRCQTCGFGYTMPGLKRAEIGQFYSRYYPLARVDTAALASSSIPHPLVRWLLGLNHTCHWQTRAGEKVLDIGSGSGRSLVEIKLLGGRGYGVEPDPTAQGLAAALGLTLHQGFITDHPFPRTRFDLVTGSQVIEHERDPVAFLRAASDKLKTGGRIVVSTPNLDSLPRVLYGRDWINWHIPYHLSLFSRQSMAELAIAAGLEIVSMKTVTPSNWLAMNLLSWWGRKERRMGRRSPIWVVAPKPFLSRLSFAVLLLAVSPLARLIDLLGRGESLVVTLRRP